MSTNKIRITADDLFTGLFAALAEMGYRVIAMESTKFDEAIHAAVAPLEEDDPNVRLRFRIVLNRLHGDSPLVRDSIANAAQRDMISLDNPEFRNIRLKIDRESAGLYFKRLPGGPTIYRKIAERFLQHYMRAA